MAVDRDAQLCELRTLVGLSRSPGLFGSPDDFLTERLLAHPATQPLPSCTLGNSPPAQNASRVEIAERLLRAYHLAIRDQQNSSLTPDAEDLWTGLIRNELSALMESIESHDPVRLAAFLQEFGQSFSWFGGITTCVDGYSRDRRPDRVALTYFDKIVSLAEYLGVLRHESPESGPWGENLHVNVDDLLRTIEDRLGISVAPPMGIVYTDGLATETGLFHYRHINSLYSALRIHSVNGTQPVCEFGAGLGMTAMYSRRLGTVSYSILDLPITCLLAGHYLLQAVDCDSIALYGEPVPDGAIRILPYWECINLPSQSFGLCINQDSLPEIADNLVAVYLEQVKRLASGRFLSINHECFHPRTVDNFVRAAGGYRKLYRFKCWVREGYVEELFESA